MENSNNRKICSLNVQLGEPCFVFPAEKTEDGLYYLSNLDQNHTILVKTAYCFEATNIMAYAKPVQVMKRSLGKVLVPYYPLAGQLTVSSNGKLIVNCNGEGVLFVEAEANCTLDKLGHVKKEPDASILNKLVYVPASTSILQMPLLMVQVTNFRCGGFIIGLTMNHCMCDGVAAMEFVNSWGEIARGLPLSIPPFLDRTFLKPRSPLKITHDPIEYSEVPLKITGETGEDVIPTSFCLNMDKLAELKHKVLVSDDTFNKYPCTTFQALSAHIWRARTLALNLHPDQITKLVIVVDVRSRMNPPLPKGYFGNGIVFSSSLCKAGELINSPLSFAVKLIQESIKKVTDDFIRSAIDYLEETRARLPWGSTVIITSWTKLAFESADFGWGQPTFSWPVDLSKKEMIVCIPHGADKRGIIVHIWLPPSASKAFQELMTFKFQGKEI